MLLDSAYYAAGAGWAAATKRQPFGRSIFNHPDGWDVCIVLDSLRVDTAREVFGPRVGHVESVWSRGSITTEWLTQTFRSPHRDEIADTTLISANPHSTSVFDDGQWLTSPDDAPIRYPENPAVGREDFADVHELWRTHATEHHAVPPETMADATIQAWRDGADRLVAHWLQPHEPFIGDGAPIRGGRATETSVWDAARRGAVDTEDVVTAYRATAARAVESVRRVLDGIDAKVLITADHGNLFGELGQWGHPFGMLHPAVRRVPWTTVSATRTHGVTPSITLSPAADPDVTSQLEALGYR